MYTLYLLSFTVLLSGTILYLTRSHWAPFASELPSRIAYDIRYFSSRLPGRDYLYSRLPSTFSGDIDAGLTSSNFDLNANLESGDSRAGLDDAAKREILKIMQRRRIQFDEARRIYMEQRFRENGIGADGRPRDPKFVSFS